MQKSKNNAYNPKEKGHLLARSISQTGAFNYTRFFFPLTLQITSQYYVSLNGAKEDCFVVVSYSGTTRKICEYIENIKKTSSRLILITSFGNDLWKKEADVVLPMSTRERIYSTNIATYTSALSTAMIFDLLYSLYFHAHFDEAFTMKRARSIVYEANRKPSVKIMEEEE